MKLTRREALSALGAIGMGGVVSGQDFLGAEAPRSPGRLGRDSDSRRAQLYELLGDLPERKRPLSARKVSEEERDGYVLETLELELNGFEPVPAFFARPKGAAGRLPTVLFNHSHGGQHHVGKTEFVEGRSYLQAPPTPKW
jgi:hypothetical protein